jgi:hypothetical protein
MSDLLDQVHAREWFYRYELPDGSHTATYHAGSLDAIHETRWRMLEQCLDQEFPLGLGSVQAVDLAAHQGWFATRLAQSGIGSVHGIDARASHVADSRLISAVLGLENVQFTQSDVFDIDTAGLGRFDLVLMLGLIYHLENPVGALRLARALCSKLCVIETQVVPGMSGMVDFGSYQFVRPLRGSFGIIDETDETHGPETGVTGICLVPSVEALTWLLGKVGFSRSEVLVPPADAYEQLHHGKRVMVVAHA